MLIAETSPFVCAVCVPVAGTSPCNKSLQLVPSFVPTLRELRSDEPKEMEGDWGGGNPGVMGAGSLREAGENGGGRRDI